MNGLQLFLYIADVSKTIDGLAHVIFVFSLIATILSFVLLFITASSKVADETEEILPEYIVNYLKYPRWVALVSLIFMVAIPQKSTLYMIAGVGVTETVLESPEATKVRELLNQKLDELITPEEEQN